MVAPAGVRMGIGQSRSKRGAAEITDADRAVLSLRTQRRKLANEQTRLERLVAREMQVARELVAKRQKERALLALKRRKLHEQQLERLGAWQLNVEQVLSNIEAAKQQKQLFAALKAGNEAVTDLQKEVTVDDVEKLMEDSAEAQAQQDRLHQALAGSLTPEQDAAAAEELAALEARAEAEEAAALDLPSVPHTQVQAGATAAAALDLPSVPQTEAAAPPPQRRPAEAAPQREEIRQLEEPIAA